MTTGMGFLEKARGVHARQWQEKAIQGWPEAPRQAVPDQHWEQAMGPEAELEQACGTGWSGWGPMREGRRGWGLEEEVVQGHLRLSSG